MRKLLILLLLFIGYFTKAQVLYNPSLFTVSNKSYGVAQAITTDARSQFRDTTLSSPYMRNYTGRAEVLSYLYLAKYRAGRFPIYMDSSGHTVVMWFRDGTADINLVNWNTDASSTDSSIFLTIYRNDTAKINLRNSIAGKISTTLNAGQILVGNVSNLATAVTPGNDVSVTTGGSFTVKNQWKLVGNAGTVDGTNFVGTTDNVPLSFKVNGFLAGRIDNTNANAFLGYRAGALASAANNSALGHGALLSLLSGGGNTAVGSQSLFNNTFGNNNTSIGFNSLQNTTTGASNTVVGYNSGLGITTGNYNTILGANVTGLSPALNNNIIIADGQGNSRITVDSPGTAIIHSITALGLPVGNTAQRPSAPAAGFIRFNTDSAAKETFDGSDWIKDGSGGGGGGSVISVATNNATGITGGTITSTGTLAIDTADIITTKASRKKLSDSLVVLINGKQPTGSYITALTGDVTAAGPGSATATLATIVSPGSCTNCNITYDAKGRGIAFANGTAGNISGSLTAGRVTVSSGASTITDFAGFTYNNAMRSLTADTIVNHKLRVDTTLYASTILVPNGALITSAGDSFTAGVCATTPDSIYVNKLSIFYRLPLFNYGLTGGGIGNALSQLFDNVNYPHRSFSTILAGYNNVRNEGYNIGTFNALVNGFKSAFVNQFMKNYTPAGAAGVTLSGGWSSYDIKTNYGGKSTNGAFTTSSGAYAEWSFTDSTVAWGGISFNGVVPDIIVSIDGSPVETVTMSGQADADIPYIARARYYQHLSYGAHTIRLTTASAGYFFFDYFGNLVTKNEAQTLVMYKIPYMNAAGYALGPGVISNAVFDSANLRIDSVYNVLAASGMPVYLVNINAFYNTTTDVCIDNVHPNDQGYRHIFDGTVAALGSGSAGAQNGSLFYANGGMYLKTSDTLKRIVDGDVIYNGGQSGYGNDLVIGPTDAHSLDIISNGATIASFQNGVNFAEINGNTRIFGNVQAESGTIDLTSTITPNTGVTAQLGGFGLYTGLLLTKNTGTANENHWFTGVLQNKFKMFAAGDASGIQDWISVSRTGIAIDSVTFPNGYIKVKNMPTTSASDSVVHWDRATGSFTYGPVTGGGGGNTNSNVGSAYRWAKPGTNDIKTYAVGYGLINDSSVTNQIRTTLDTATVYGYVRGLLVSADTLKLSKAGAGQGLLYAGHDTLFHKSINNATSNSDSSLTINTLEKADQTIIANRTVSGGGTLSLTLGATGSKLSGLTVNSAGNIALTPVGNVALAGGLSFGVANGSVQTGDANYTVPATGVVMITLGVITANRTIDFTNVPNNTFIIIQNVNTSAFTWNITTNTLWDANYIRATSFDNNTVYLICGVNDGVHSAGAKIITRYGGAPLQYNHTIFTPTTGGTVSLVTGMYNIINPAGALLALTVNLPSSPANNDVVYIKYTQSITTVTYGNGTVVDGITSPIAGGLVILTYDSGSTSWY